MGRLKTLDQRRGETAWAQVEAVPPELGPQYRARAREAPGLLLACGLGQTLALLLAREGRDAAALRTGRPTTASGYLYRHLEDWLLGGECPLPWPDRSGPLIRAVLEADVPLYRQASREALAYLVWLKRFAEARFQAAAGGSP
jgi:CRISPR-associated protein Cmr5